MLALGQSVIAAAALLSQPAPAIHVYSCQTFSGEYVPKTNEVGLAVRFTNTSERVYKSIVWRAAYGDGYVDFVDNGTFSPNVPVDNFVLYQATKDHLSVGNVLADLIALRFGSPGAPDPMVSQNQFTSYAGTDNPENCSIVSAVDSEGGTWTNPDTALPHVRIPRAAAYGIDKAVPTPAPALTGGVEVTSCSFSFSDLGWMNVRFRNTGQQPVHQIVFRAPYRAGAIDFTDTGTFAPDVKIVHDIKTHIPVEAHTTVYSTFDDPSSCPIVSVQYTDGTVWQNPAVAATPGPFATPVPNELDYGKERRDVWSRAQVHGPIALPNASATPSPTPAP